MEPNVKDLIRKMTLVEKIRLMHGIRGLLGLTPVTYRLVRFRTRGNSRLGVPPFVFCDGPRGIVLGRSTCFPANIGRGATWDPELEWRIGRAMGLEARHQGANACGAACVNILRHPGWGRAQETYGADPCHMAAMGSALVSGLAENVMPVIKHFACNSIELSRFRVNISIGESELREIYLPHFKACVDAGAAVIMTAYNRVNGTYCGQNRHLITDILRDEWGFTGFVISDWFLGCRSTGASIRAGLDIEMPQGLYYLPYRVKKALKKGSITGKMIDAAVGRIIETQKKFGLFNPDFVADKKIVACNEHARLALESARKSMVLLKNDGNVLPLKRDSIRTLAVIGRLAKRANLGSFGSVGVTPPWTVTPLDGIRKAAGETIRVVYARGGWRALRIARGADAVVYIGGLSGKEEGEYFPLLGGGDRKSLELDRRQERFIADVAAANKNCAVFLMGGSAVCMESWISTVPAVVMAWYPGMAGGTAVAEVLFGDIAPSGRLPITIPRFSGQLPLLDTKTSEVTYDCWHDYTYFERHGIEPRFPFGFGLGYTTFSYRGLELELAEGSGAPMVKVSFRVKNNGNRRGEETSQVYVACENPGDEWRRVKKLKAFARVLLDPGEERRVTLDVPAKDCLFYNAGRKAWELDESPYLFFTGPSSRDLPLSGKLSLKQILEMRSKF